MSKFCGKESANFLCLLAFVLVGVPAVQAIVCYKCDSMALEACAMTLDDAELPIEDCRTSTSCVMSIVDGVTYRGCSSNTPTADATYRKSCTENLCNRGVYPPGRMKCHHCAGDGCVERPQHKAHPCQWHLEQDQCYTQVMAADEAYRGCRSDTNHTIPSDLIVDYCDINGCNDQVGLAILRCAECNSQQGRGCKMDLFEVNSAVCNITEYAVCEVSSALSEPQTCYAYHRLDHVERGCSLNMSPEVRADEEHRSECRSADLCNRGCLQQQKCVACDSSSSSMCRSSADSLAITLCGSAEASSCYTCEYGDSQVQRGCGPAPELPERGRCYECNGADVSKCNTAALTRCYKCSTADAAGAECANWIGPSFDIDIEECSEPGAPCLMAALPGGTVQRGCQSGTLFCNDTQTECITCDGSFCNKGPFPPETLRCYQCVGEDCNGVVEALPCVPDLEQSVVVEGGEACFEYMDEGQPAVRGCRSTSTLYLACIRRNAESLIPECHICRTHGCNQALAV